MPEYRREKIPGGMYFFTVVSFERKPIFLEEKSRISLNHAFQTVKKHHPFDTVAIVLLPEHIHTIWNLPEDDFDFSSRWKLIKRKFTQLYLKDVSLTCIQSLSRWKKNEREVWQRRFWEHHIRDETDFKNHLDYIHYNPVKHGYVTKPSDWQWSTFDKYVKKGWYEVNWGNSSPLNILRKCVGEMGE